MGENGGIDEEIELPGGSFSRLLLSSSDDVDNQSYFLYSPTPLFSTNTPKMLCFGDFASETTRITHSDSSSPSSGGTNTNPNTSNPNKRRNGSGQEPGQRSGNGQKKKNKPEVGPILTSSGHAKGRREKLGERISALQQLVSPFGKTDTASVLHEAMGYIRFLHEQVKVLSSPFLQRLSSSPHPHHFSENDGTKGRETIEGLRRRGLCLVPVDGIIDVVNNNGADFWSPTTTSPSKA